MWYLLLQNGQMMTRRKPAPRWFQFAEVIDRLRHRRFREGTRCAEGGLYVLGSFRGNCTRYNRTMTSPSAYESKAVCSVRLNPLRPADDFGRTFHSLRYLSLQNIEHEYRETNFRIPVPPVNSWAADRHLLRNSNRVLCLIL